MNKYIKSYIHKKKSAALILLNFMLLVFVFTNVLAIGEIPGDVPEEGTLVKVFKTIKEIIDAIVPLVMILATAVFIWGIIQYVLAGGSDTRKKEAKSLIIWGLIGIFVIAAMWGIANIISTTFDIGVEGTPSEPGVIFE